MGLIAHVVRALVDTTGITDITGITDTTGITDITGITITICCSQLQNGLTFWYQLPRLFCKLAVKQALMPFS